MARFIAKGNTAEARAALAGHLAAGWRPEEGLGDDTLDAIRDNFRRFAQERIAPFAQRWHLANELIPDGVVTQMGDLGASEELSRA